MKKVGSKNPKGVDLMVMAVGLTVTLAGYFSGEITWALATV